MRKQWWWVLLLLPLFTQGQGPETPFEQSGGRQTATYGQCIAFYQQLDKLSPLVAIRKMCMSDAGFPYHVVLYSNDGTDDPVSWHRRGKVVILINNGIHPGEPDGIDASMLLIRDLVAKKIRIPDNIGLAVIPIYNIGGALNRTSFSRVNQNGPESYGFRGNGQNLDLNRDFTKNDSRNARSFAEIFHWLDPDLQIDNHVSDGADYQYTMTLLSTQWNKLGGQLGTFLHDELQPALFRDMAQRGWPMTPYVEFEAGNPREGWNGFYDEPRYSSGYAALFHTIAFMPETHMLKPFRDRVLATYALMQAMIAQCSRLSGELLRKRKQDIAADLDSTRLALDWKVDRSKWDTVLFKGYETRMKTSEVTGLQRMYYDHSKPFERPVKFYTWFSADAWVTVPKAYVIPQAWHAVIDLLQLNQVRMRRLTRDSAVSAEIYHIADYKSYPRAYEKHHKNTAIRVRTDTGIVQLRKGDYIVTTGQTARRFLVEMLEPTGEDSYFAWNFFDAILQQKEGYSAYRWEDVAGEWLKQHPDIRAALDARRQTDSAFAKNARAQLEFVYIHSPYYEPAHLRYPVYRIMK